jgi:dTMP kinase
VGSEVELVCSFSQHRNNLKKTLSEGTTLVVDRYAYSGAVYTASKVRLLQTIFISQGYDLQWCKSPDVGLPRPDLVIFLDISVEEAMKRGEFGQERYEKKEFQEMVRELYLKMVEDNWRIVDATQSQEALEEQLLAMVKEVQEKVASEPIQELWVS